jgi:glutathione S-transferase
MSLKFYSFPRSSGTRVQWALEELGVEYEYVLLDRAKQEHLGSAYLAINPNGKVPALVDDGERLFESIAILIHLGEKYGVAKGLWPKEPGQRGDAMSWTVWSTTELGTFGIQFAYHGLDTPVSYAKEQRSQAAADYNRQMLDRALAVLEARLEGRQYIVGDGFTLADLANASVLRFLKMFGMPLEGRQNVAGWLERCSSRPALARVK